jgi:hypothetical protein
VSLSVLHIHVLALCPCPCCMYMPMSMQHVRVHAKCLPIYMLHVYDHDACSLSMLHVHANALWPCPWSLFVVHAACPCQWIMTMSMVHDHVNAYLVFFEVRKLFRRKH